VIGANPRPPLRTREAINAAGKKKPARISITGSRLRWWSMCSARPAPRAYTPSRLLGADLVTRLPGCEPLRIT